MRHQSLIKLTLSVLVLAAILSSLIWINSLTQFSNAPTSSRQVDTFLKNATIEQFSINGSLAKTTQVSLLNHYQKLGSSEFVNPIITLYSQNSPPWKITAQRGNSSHDNQIIELDGHVIAFQAATQDASSTTIHSKQLLYNVKQKIIYTDDFVTIVREKSVTQGQGLIFNLLTNRLILKSHMVTHFLAMAKSKPASAGSKKKA